MSEDEIRRRIKEQSVLASRCKRCGDVFVVDHNLMGHDKPDLDRRIVHLRECLKDINIRRLDDYVETIRLRVPSKYSGQKTVFFDELCLTQEQVYKLTRKLSDWLHFEANT